MKNFIGILAIFLLTLSAPLAQAQANQGTVLDTTEINALQKFYALTNGAQWGVPTTNTWRIGQDTTLVMIAARWSGITVQGGDVTGLNLQFRNVVGPIPAVIERLRALKVLNLAFTRISGPIPRQLGQLTRLTSLQLNSSNGLLTGGIPPELGQLIQLQSLSLRGNPLMTGSLPATLGNLRRLRSLDISYMGLSGALPRELGQLDSLQTFTVIGSGNYSGPIPSAWGRMRRLQSLNLSFNGLRGAIPDSLGQLTALTSLVLGSNKLTGEIPASLGQLPNLVTLALNNNQLSGAVPASLTTCSTLRTLNLATNQLSRLPGFLSAARNANNKLALTVSNNRLTFEDVERNLSGPQQSLGLDFIYTGQAPPAPADTVERFAGTYVTLSRPAQGAHSHYQWQRLSGCCAWVDMPGDTLLTKSLAVLDATKEGSYRLAVTNRWVDGAIKFWSKAVYVTMLPGPALTENLPFTRTPPALLSALAPADRDTAQDRTINYVRTWAPRVALTDTARVRLASIDSVQMATQYSDGLGRPVQTVARGASPTYRDVVQITEYDAASRQPRDYLPYTPASGLPAGPGPVTGPAGSTRGGYRPNARFEQYRYYAAPTAGTTYLPPTAVAFAERIYDASPLARVAVQGAPGEAWHASTNSIQWFEERPNTTADSVQRWEPGFGTTLAQREVLTYQGPYAAGELWVQLAYDEHSHPMRTFTDKAGNVVLRQEQANSAEVMGDGNIRRSWASTYFIFDRFGRERAVLPPAAVQLVRQNNWAITSAVSLLVTRTHYDLRGRPFERRLPDATGYTYAVFDGLDRPVLTQNPAQASRREWSATKYDALGRVILTALLTYPSVGNPTPTTLQTQADAATTWWEQRTTVAGAGGTYYTDAAFPRLTVGGSSAPSVRVLSTTDYDDHDFNNDGTPDASYDRMDDGYFSAAPQADSRTRGLVTRTRVRVLDQPATSASAWLETTIFYDDQARPLQTLAGTARGGSQRQTYARAFRGEVTQTVTTTTDRAAAPTHPPLTVIERRTYDHTGRPLDTRQQLVGDPTETLLSHVVYNELGQVKIKQLGAGGVLDPDQTRRNSLQRLDYRYNIRGWLTNVNGLALPVAATREDSLARALYHPVDLFGMALSYERGFAFNQYNGNIAGQRWYSAADGVTRTYGYQYDQRNRLTQADYAAYHAPTQGYQGDYQHYRFSGVSYDANGNLLSLRRRGLVSAATRTTPASYAETDNLRYYYVAGSNRLNHVDDLAQAVAGTATTPRRDVQDYLTAGTSAWEFAYDAVGNTTYARVENLNDLQYNHLNLTRRVQFATAAADTLVYRWAADGQKLGARQYKGGLLKQRLDYVAGGAWVYENDSLRYWRTSEGRALYQPRNAAHPVSYEYNIADQLGNVRVSFHPGERQQARASLSLEPQQRQTETHQFDSLSIERARYPAGHSIASDGYVARLTAAGTAPVPVGPTKSLRVQKGDTIRATANFYYDPQTTGATNWQFNLLSVVTSWLTQPTQLGTDGRKYSPSLPWLAVALGSGAPTGLWSGGVPHAYLRLATFNKDSALVSDQVLPITSLAANAWQERTLTTVVGQDGYVLVYEANDSDRPVDVDEVVVDYRPTLQVQEQHYDPFGMELVGLTRNGLVPTNRYLFNGKEAQNQLGLNWTDHGWRMFDPQLGRWHVVDPGFSEAGQISWSSYHFGFNNPIKYNDLDGRKPDDYYSVVNYQLVRLGSDGSGNGIRIVPESSVNNVLPLLNGSSTTENQRVTLRSDDVSKKVSFNEERVKSEFQGAHDRSTQGSENSAYIFFDDSKNEVTAKPGPSGANDMITHNYQKLGLNNQGSWNKDGLIIGIGHGHPATTRAGQKNLPGYSKQDAASAAQLPIARYAIDSYATPAGGAATVHRTVPGDNAGANPIGTTQSLPELGRESFMQTAIPYQQ